LAAGLPRRPRCDGPLAGGRAALPAHGGCLARGTRPQRRTRAADPARWRLFFLGCSELFGYRGGQEWWVSHVAMRPRGSAA
jgi:hypothetical protein